MPKAYLVSNYTAISDTDKLAAYAKLAGPAIEALGGRYIARGVAARAMEAGVQQRTVIVEFDSLETALSLYDDSAYQIALKALDGGAVRDMRIVEGVA
ncbi:DUF1330 domain-containing protein [Lichenihabitans psoromatis]|uniref:DUF1330 domain-containing protein n=1 Tax=Lichenihabitans psoromatis TaxID=2528642 RepID=UPI0010383EDC|nr:DUF1330 domain-containing protein [Lichenihabitans psoromatis]